MTDQVKIKLYIGTGFAGLKHEDEEFIDREEWESMTESEREDYLETAAQTYLSNKIEYSAYVEDDN